MTASVGMSGKKFIKICLIKLITKNNNMNTKRLFKKFIGGGIIQGHIIDALQKKKETGKSFNDCLKQSVKETFTEDLPGTSHIYNMGKKDGRVQGIVEQTKRDERKMKQIDCITLNVPPISL